MIVGTRSFVSILIVLVTFGGLGLGALLALASRQHVVTSGTTATTSTTVARVAPTRAQVHHTAQPLVVHSAEPMPVETATPARVTPAAATPAQTVVAQPATAGTWTIEEANVVDGMMIWVGSAGRDGANLSLVVHKASIAGRSASPCERSTDLHLAIAPARGSQTVPYTEVNCAGEAMTGTVQIASMTANSFTGSFWDGSKKLGNFTAMKQ